MPVYSVWESHFPPEQTHEGRAITEAIWRDMPQFDGYLTHELIEDLDDPGHLLASVSGRPATVPRKPDRGPTIHPDPPAGPATAAKALGLRRVDTSQLSALRELHKTIVQLVDGLLTGRPAARPAARLTSLARPSIAAVRLDVSRIRPCGHS